jgi:hypothetical protein
MKIDDFKANLRGKHLASPANFRVMFSGGVLKHGPARAITYQCNQAMLPGKQFGTNEIRTYGPVRKMPYSHIFDDLQMSIYCTEDMDVKKTFDDWMNAVGDNITGDFNYYNNYTTDIDIEQLDANGKVVYAIKVLEAYPMMVQPLALDYSQQNSFHNLPVTFAYRKWREEPLALNPFGSNLNINSLYPNLDIQSTLDRFGVAVVSRADGQVTSRIDQGISFAGAISSAASSSNKTQSLDNFFVN